MKTKLLMVIGWILISTSIVQAWTGDTWGPISRQTITTLACEMIDSTWTPLHDIVNYNRSSGKSYYSGITYTGELYTNSNCQNWGEFIHSLSTTAGGNTYYGNNCEGFVDITWKLPKVYHIASIDSNLGGNYFYALGDFGEGPYVSLQPGDAFYTSGHIWLFNQYKPDGTIQSMEQVPPAARRRTWSWSALRNFRPIRRALVDGGFALNDRVQTSFDVSVRSCPSLNCDLVWTAPMAAQGIVIGGPQNADQYRWWKIQYDNYESSGWTDEGHLKKMIDQTLTCGSISDFTSPTGSMTINTEARYTGARSVMLNLSCEDDDSGCAWMQFSQDGSLWTPWEPYATSKNWVLTPGDGDKTVQAQFKDACGNISIDYAKLIILQTPYPDFIISSLVIPTVATTGATISIADTTSNIGTGGANASTTSYFISRNNAIDAGDFPLGGRAVPTLSAGESSAGTTSVTIPTDLAPGIYYIYARANSVTAVDCGYITPCGLLAESSRNNNSKYKAISVGPDLIIFSLSATTVSRVGAIINITDTTKNIGGDMAGASTTSFYLSTGTAIGSGSLFLGSRPAPSLGAGASSKGTTSVTIPFGISSGTYYIIAKADGLNDVVEANENNNTKYKVISIEP